MPIILAIATHKELYSILPELQEQNIIEHIPFLFSKNEHDFIIVLTGIAPINAGIAMGKALHIYPKVEAVLNIGLAGTFEAQKAPIGSTIIVSEEIWPEYGLHYGQRVDAENFGFALWQDSDETIINNIKLSTKYTKLKFNKLSQIIEGKSLTVAGVSANIKRCETLKEQYSPLIENMEGFAIALACKRQDIPIVEIRIVSNLVGSRDKKDWNFALAFENMHHVFNQLINANF